MCAVSHSVKPRTTPKRRPTQADVAERAGVSTATVSHILSGRSDRKGTGNVRTRERVEQAMEELGYRPNWAGRALRRQRTGLIGALVSAPSNPWRENLVALAQEELARHGLDLVVFPDVRPGAGLDRVRDLLDRRVVDACFTVHLEDDDQPSHLSRSAIPVIAFAESGFDGVAKVRHGYADAAQEAALSLRARGVRRFVLARERTDGGGSRDTVFTAPILSVLERDSAAAEVVQVDISYRIGADLTGMPWRMLSGARREDPVVVMCHSDRLAIQVAAECDRRGIGLGRSVGVVGRGDLPEGARMPVPLSTLGGGGADYTAVFAALADASRTGAQIDEEWTFPWRFVERSSTSELLRE